MNNAARVLPVDLIQEVERFITEEHDRAEKYVNSEVLDSNGAFVLHRLAARIYAQGWEDGERAQVERDDGQRQRERARAAAALAEPEDPSGPSGQPNEGVAP